MTSSKLPPPDAGEWRTAIAATARSGKLNARPIRDDSARRPSASHTLRSRDRARTGASSPQSSRRGISKTVYRTVALSAIAARFGMLAR